MVSSPSRSRLLSTAFRRDLALKRYGRGANLVAMSGIPSKPPSRKISPMILSEAPLPYISAVSTRVTPSAMLARKALPTSIRLYSLPYPQSLVVPHAQAPTPRGATLNSSARPIVSSPCKPSPFIPSPRHSGERGPAASQGGIPDLRQLTASIPPRLSQNSDSTQSPDAARLFLLGLRFFGSLLCHVASRTLTSPSRSIWHGPHPMPRPREVCNAALSGVGCSAADR